LRDHETHLVDEELAGLAYVVDLAGSIEKVDGNLDRFIEQERGCIVELG
jgi:hypothetical protein